MTCPMCGGKHVIFSTNEQGEDIASPCSCLADSKAESAIKIQEQKGTLIVQPYYLEKFEYAGQDKENKDALLQRVHTIRKLWLYGSPKTQKTSFAVLILKKLAGMGKHVDYISMGDLNRMIYSAGAFSRGDDASEKLQYYREAEVLIIDDVYADKYVTFSTGTQNTYWSDFVDSRRNQTIFVSQYHPANPPDNWKGALLDIDSIEIIGFHYSNIDDMPNISIPRKRKIVNAR